MHVVQCHLFMHVHMYCAFQTYPCVAKVIKIQSLPGSKISPLTISAKMHPTDQMSTEIRVCVCGCDVHESTCTCIIIQTVG